MWSCWAGIIPIQSSCIQCHALSYFMVQFHNYNSSHTAAVVCLTSIFPVIQLLTPPHPANLPPLFFYFSYMHIYPGTLLNSLPSGHIPIFVSSGSTCNPDTVLATQAQLATSISGNSMATPATEAACTSIIPASGTITNIANVFITTEAYQKDSKLAIRGYGWVNSWHLGLYLEEETVKCCHHACQLQKKGKVKDIVLWVECFSIYAGVLTTKYPQSAPSLMVYQRTILHASRTYKGDC